MPARYLNILLSGLLPPRCLLCGQRGLDDWDLCGGCFNDLPLNQQACIRCAAPLSDADADECETCQLHPPAFDHTYAPFLYAGAMPYLITGLKFRRRYAHARTLGALLADMRPAQTGLPDCFIPVPLHRNRYLERGFNQAIEISRTLSRHLGVPMDLNACQRQRDTPHQTGLSARERRSNIQNAFRVQPSIAYQHIALIDDVLTTGSTVNELATQFKRAGVVRVDVWVCARTTL